MLELNLTGYIVTFLSGVGALFVFLQARSMYRARIDAARKREIALQLVNLRNANALLAGAKKFPFSKDLYTCLYHRLLIALEALVELEPENAKLVGRVEYVKDKLNLLKSSSTSADKKGFTAPTNELEAIELLKLIKRFRLIVRNGHTKGLISKYGCIYETARLDSFQTQIIIGNLIKRANYAIEKNQEAIARELVKKGIHYLNSKSGTQSMDMILVLSEELEKIEAQLNGEHPLNELIGFGDDEDQEIENELQESNKTALS